MTSKATVFLNHDRTKAVSAGDPHARFKLVHAGQEIAQADAEKYEGTIELIGGTKKSAAPAEDKIETREPEPQHRDPKKHK